MRLIFMFCLVCSAVAVAAPGTTEAEVVIPLTARFAAVEGHAHPQSLVVVAEATPTPTPGSSPNVAAPPVSQHTPTPVPTAPPTPEPTPTPVPTPKPTPPPTPTPTKPPATSPPSGGSFSRQQVADGIRRTWEGDDEKAVRVADCESGLNPRATSRDGQNLGLWQFRLDTWRNYGGTGDPRDHSPEQQTAVALRLFQARGWAPWPGCV